MRWEPLADRVFACRIPFCDVTVGLIVGNAGVVLIDTGTTLTEAHAIAADAVGLAGRAVTHVVLTHNHFDHITGFSMFAGAATYCAPAVVATMADRKQHLRADAVAHGADPAEMDRALRALRPPGNPLPDGVVDLGDRVVTVTHPGRGHTDHDLIAVVTGAGTPVVFCGDLIEESGDPCVDADSDLPHWPSTLQAVLSTGGESARYVPGHGAPVDASFVRRQADWLARLGQL